MRLIKLAAFALFGYALYEFFRGVLNDTQVGAQLGNAMNRMSQGQSGPGSQQAAFGSVNESSGMNISGPGEGERVSTVETDGGAVGHQVGRGVIS